MVRDVVKVYAIQNTLFIPLQKFTVSSRANSREYITKICLKKIYIKKKKKKYVVLKKKRNKEEETNLKQECVCARARV